MDTRIYAVKEAGTTIALIEATSQAQAIRTVCGKRFTAEVPSTKELAKLMHAGFHVVNTEHEHIGDHTGAVPSAATHVQQ